MLFLAVKESNEATSRTVSNWRKGELFNWPEDLWVPFSIAPAGAQNVADSMTPR